MRKRLKKALTTNVENIVASDQDLAQVAGEGAVNVLLGVGQLEVHVAVDGDQVALVYVISFELFLENENR